MRRYGTEAMILWLVLGAAPAVAADAFVQLATAGPVTDIALSADGAHLLAACEESDRVDIFNIDSGQRVASVETPSPRHVMCRGDAVYVANKGPGTITVVDGSSWRTTRTIAVGEKDVIFLDAPQGEYFGDELLATTTRSAQAGSEQFMYAVYAVSLKKNQQQSRKVRERVSLGEARVSFRGDLVREWFYYDYANYAGGRLPLFPASRVPSHRGQPPFTLHRGRITSDRYQVADNVYWFDYRSVSAGTTSASIWPGQKQPFNQWIVPDRTRKLVYALRDDEESRPKKPNVLYAHKLDESFAEVGSRQLQPGKQQALQRYEWTVPIAVTRAAGLSIFLVCSDRTLIWYRGEPYPERREQKPVNSDPPRTSRLVAVNETIQEPLSDRPAGAAYTLMKGPDGSAVTADGQIQWTPKSEQVGKHSFKVKCQVAGKVTILRMDVEVIDATAQVVEKVAAQTDRPRGTHYVLHENYQLQPALDGNSMLLVEGAQVRLLDGEGLIETSRSALPGFYLRLAERDEYYVAASHHSIDLLDKSTFKLRKRIPLNCLATNDLAILPGKKICYVALELNSGDGEDVRMRNRPVVLVDEEKGSVTNTGIYGMWLAMEPRGRTLHAYLRGSAKEQEKFSIGKFSLTHRDDEVLVTYTLRGAKLTPWKMRSLYNTWGTRLLASDDGQFLSYISFKGLGGEPGESEKHPSRRIVPSYQAKDITKLQALYDVRKEHLVDMAFHPTQELVAAANTDEVFIFARKTGKPLDGAIDLGGRKLQDIQRVWFSGGGQHVLIDHRDAQGRRAIVAFPLRAGQPADR